MSDLLDKNGQLLISPGELWDRITIAKVKMEMVFDDQDKVETVLAEMDRLEELMANLMRLKPCRYPAQLVFVIRALYECNWKQWEMEDKVRSEKSWEAAVAARENNTERVAWKNEINKLFDYPEEIKKYMTSGE